MTGEGQYLEDTGYLGSDVSYIDCGLDGSIEMIVYINLETEFIPTMVIKNVDGNLKICYAYDSWSRSNTEVYYNGVVSSYGSSGADLHGGYTGFIDAAGDYHFWYGETEECFGNRDEDNTLVYYYNEDHIIEGADMLFLESITFDNEEFYYYFYLTDSDYNDVEDASVNGVNPYDTVSDILTEEQGLSLISSTEAQIMIENRRLEIGLSDEVYSYGDEYRPE